jgi:hypothetical protein
MSWPMSKLELYDAQHSVPGEEQFLAGSWVKHFRLQILYTPTYHVQPLSTI